MHSDLQKTPNPHKIATRSRALDILLGALGGAVLACLLLSGGVLRAAVVRLVGHGSVAVGPGDIHLIEYYIGTFALVGASLGAARPLLRTRAGTLVSYGVGGAIVGISIAAVDKGTAAKLSLSDIALGVFVGAICGCAFAFGRLRARG